MLVRTMRRKDRALSLEESLALLRKCEYGILASCGGDGPLATPLSYVLLAGSVYFHCAAQGHKIDNLRRDDRVCFTVVGQTKPVMAGELNFSTEYESVLVFGKARAVEEEKEKYIALCEMAGKYLPERLGDAPAAVKRFGSRTAVYAVDIEEISGKANKLKPE